MQRLDSFLKNDVVMWGVLKGSLLSMVKIIV